jgi:hypothetical protein
MGTELAITKAAELVRNMPAEARQAMRADLTARVDTISDEDFTVLEALEAYADRERVTRLPKVSIVHHGVAKPGVDLGGELIRDFEAVIVIHEPRRGLWPKTAEDARSGGPLCSSQDAVTPVQAVTIRTTRGDEHTGPQCAGCLFAQWGSAGLMDLDAADSNGQACKQQVLMVLLVRGKDVPVLLFVPPTSLKEFEQYKSTMAYAGRSLIGHYTRFRVEKAEGASGYQYGALSMEPGDQLDVADRRRMFQLRALYESTVRATTVAAAADDVAGVDEQGGVVEAEAVDEDVPPPDRPFTDEPPF